MQIQSFSKLAPELIEWEDISQADETWIGADGIASWFSDRGDCFVDQIGFVLYEDDHCLLIADSYIESMELYGNVTKIPKSVIRKRVKLLETN